MKTKIQPKKVIKIIILSATEHDWFYTYVGRELMVTTESEDDPYYILSSLQANLLGFKLSGLLLIPKIYADTVTTNPFAKNVKSYPMIRLHHLINHK